PAGTGLDVPHVLVQHRDGMKGILHHLAKLLLPAGLGELLRGDVHVHPDPAPDVALGVTERDGADRHPAPLAGAVADATLVRKTRLGAHGVSPGAGGAVAVLRMK